MIGEVLPFSVQFKATNQMIGSISDLGTHASVCSVAYAAC